MLAEKIYSMFAQIGRPRSKISTDFVKLRMLRHTLFPRLYFFRNTQRDSKQRAFATQVEHDPLRGWCFWRSIADHKLFLHTPRGSIASALDAGISRQICSVHLRDDQLKACLDNRVSIINHKTSSHVHHRV